MPESQKVQELREQRELQERQIGLAHADAHSPKPSLSITGNGGMTEAQRRLDLLQRDAKLMDAQIRAAIDSGL
jgi:hypothetical protein